VPCGGDIDPSIGITSTPVIDPATDRIYAVGAVSASGTLEHELFALNLSSGTEVPGFPVNVDPSYPGGGAPINQLQRTGLALDDGRILIGYGGNSGDCGTYWGWLVSVPVDGATGTGVFQADPDYDQGAIWGAGNSPPVDASGNVFIATGNGSSSSSTNPDYGDSVVKLNASASLLDWWAPSAPISWQSLDSSDLDLGSGMPTLLRGGYLFQAGKDGNGYLLDGAALGQVATATRTLSNFCPGGSWGGSIYDPANSTIYAACSAGTRALTVGAGSPPSVAADTSFVAPSSATGPPTIGGGLVWVVDSNGGTLYGLDPNSGNADQQFMVPENTEPGGSDVNHFASPSAGGGRLFVGSGDQVTAYLIAQPPPPSSTTTSLASSANPVHGGTVVSLTAAVTPAPDAGTITFTDGTSPLAGCTGIAVSLATAGRTICQATFTQTGTHDLTASYSGDPYYLTSTSQPLAESVTGSGSGSPGGGSPPGGVAQRPVISHVSISRSRGNRHAATLRLTLNETMLVTVVILASRHGRTAGHLCSTRKRTGRPCLKLVTIARLRFAGRRGANAFTLSLRTRRSGHYTAVIYAADKAGRRSRVIRIRFTITHHRR
jgi:hypothetical protein